MNQEYRDVIPIAVMGAVPLFLWVPPMFMLPCLLVQLWALYALIRMVVMLAARTRRLRNKLKGDKITVYSIYDVSPNEDGTQFCIVRHFLSRGGEKPEIDGGFYIKSANLDFLRQVLLADFHLQCMGRHEKDVNNLIETWV